MPGRGHGVPVLRRAGRHLLVALRFNEVVGRPRDRATPSALLRPAPWTRRVEHPADPANGSGVDRELHPAAALLLAEPPPRIWSRRGRTCCTGSGSCGCVSALLAALTTLFTFLFLREVLEEPWTWTVGALAVAFQPLFGFISSGVHPGRASVHGLRRRCSSVSRARFRHGLTPELGAWHRARARRRGAHEAQLLRLPAAARWARHPAARLARRRRPAGRAARGGRGARGARGGRLALRSRSTSSSGTGPSSWAAWWSASRAARTPTRPRSRSPRASSSPTPGSCTCRGCRS